MSINRNYLLISVIVALLLVFGGLVTVLSGTSNGIDAGTQDQNGKKIPVEYYYDPSCGSCNVVHPFIEQYESNSSDISVAYYNIGSDNSSAQKFAQLQKSLGHVHVPFVLMGDRYLTGQDNIIQNFDILVQKIKNNDIEPGDTPQEYMAP